MNCKTCKKPLTGRQIKFCSRKCTNADTNHRNQNYQAQQLRGLRRKVEAIEKLGGACALCGYDSNYAALCFHHVEEKAFGLDLRQFSNRSQNALDKELEKCLLLCHNCHMEHHHPDMLRSYIKDRNRVEYVDENGVRRIPLLEKKELDKDGHMGYRIVWEHWAVGDVSNIPTTAALLYLPDGC